MNKNQPVGNRYLEAKWHQIRLKKHYEKISKMKPAIANKKPKTYSFITNKAKKEAADRMRNQQIDRDNQSLFERMTNIKHCASDRSIRPFKLDSLNRDHRRQEILRITAENQHMLKRLQNSQPFYTNGDFQRDHKRNQTWMKNLCQFPYVLGTKSPPTLRGCLSEPKLEPLSPQSSKKVLYKKGLNINEVYILVEVNFDDGVYQISGYNVENPQTLTLELEQEIVEAIIGEEKNYEKLCDRLSIENESLILSKDEESLE